jgi:hypothetical protein
MLAENFNVTSVLSEYGGSFECTLPPRDIQRADSILVQIEGFLWQEKGDD